MTRTESKLRKAGFNNEIDADQITFNGPREIEIYVTDSDGDHDYDATDELEEKVNKVLNWGGYKCGWGAWCLRKNYVSYGPDAGR